MTSVIKDVFIKKINSIKRDRYCKCGFLFSTFEKFQKSSKLKKSRPSSLWKNEFPPYSKILRGKSALFDLSDDDMSLMAQCFPDEMSNMGIHGKLAVCLRILLRRPSLYARKIIPAMLSFGYSRAKYYGW